MSDNANPAESATSDHTDPSIKLDSDVEATASETTVFKPFERFPFEIREMIWGLAACEPRVVEVEFIVKHANRRPEAKVKYHTDHRLISGTPTPAILHACSESRTVGKKLYDWLPSSKFKDIYINWESDIIVFGNIRSLFDKITWVFSAGNGGTPAGQPTCDWLWEIKEKCVRFGVHDKHALSFVTAYDHREHFKKLKEILVFSQTPNDGCNGDVAIASRKKQVTSVTEWWKTFQERPEAEIPTHLKDSIRYVDTFRDKDRLLWRERRETSLGESSVSPFALEAVDTIEMTDTAETLQDFDDFALIALMTFDW